MESSALMNIHVQLKRIYTALNETYDLTRQLADAVDRNDQVTVQMLVAMRQEPVEKLRRGQQVLDQLKAALPPEAQGPMEELLKGTGTPAPEEAALALGRPVKTIHTQLSRGKGLLRKRLERSVGHGRIS